MVHFGGGEAGGVGVGGPWSSIQNKKVSTHVLILSFVHVIRSFIHSFVMQSELFQKTRTQHVRLLGINILIMLVLRLPDIACPHANFHNCTYDCACHFETITIGKKPLEEA